MNGKLIKQLYDRYYSEIYLYLFSYCKNEEQAKDLTQETFLKAIFSLKEEHTNMRAWLYMVARNLYLNEYKKNKHKVPFESVMQMQEVVSGEKSVLDHILKEEQNKVLYQALENIKPNESEVLKLQYFGGLSQKEIAKILRISPENVRILSYRGKRDIKKYLEGSNYDI